MIKYLFYIYEQRSKFQYTFKIICHNQNLFKNKIFKIRVITQEKQTNSFLFKTYCFPFSFYFV